eukprot:scaffold9.g3213.t1
MSSHIACDNAALMTGHGAGPLLAAVARFTERNMAGMFVTRDELRGLRPVPAGRGACCSPLVGALVRIKWCGTYVLRRVAALSTYGGTFAMQLEGVPRLAQASDCSGTSPFQGPPPPPPQQQAEQQPQEHSKAASAECAEFAEWCSRLGMATGLGLQQAATTTWRLRVAKTWAEDLPGFLQRCGVAKLVSDLEDALQVHRTAGMLDAQQVVLPDQLREQQPAQQAQRGQQPAQCEQQREAVPGWQQPQGGLPLGSAQPAAAPQQHPPQARPAANGAPTARAPAPPELLLEALGGAQQRREQATLPSTDQQQSGSSSAFVPPLPAEEQAPAAADATLRANEARQWQHQQQQLSHHQESGERQQPQEPREQQRQQRSSDCAEWQRSRGRSRSRSPSSRCPQSGSHAVSRSPPRQRGRSRVRALFVRSVKTLCKERGRMPVSAADIGVMMQRLDRRAAGSWSPMDLCLLLEAESLLSAGMDHHAPLNCLAHPTTLEKMARLSYRHSQEMAQMRFEHELAVAELQKKHHLEVAELELQMRCRPHALPSIAAGGGAPAAPQPDTPPPPPRAPSPCLVRSPYSFAQRQPLIPPQAARAQWTLGMMRRAAHVGCVRMSEGAISCGDRFRLEYGWATRRNGGQPVPLELRDDGPLGLRFYSPYTTPDGGAAPPCPSPTGALQQARGRRGAPPSPRCLARSCSHPCWWPHARVLRDRFPELIPVPLSPSTMRAGQRLYIPSP